MSAVLPEMLLPTNRPRCFFGLTAAVGDSSARRTKWSADKQSLHVLQYGLLSIICHMERSTGQAGVDFFNPALVSSQDSLVLNWARLLSGNSLMNCKQYISERGEIELVWAAE
ncbi:hypothetical protein SODALDRAFT_356025 [Sodiomyces alkalinus F11]|uniref:Uncharacterized protein n=1 Tax=Sodiomyces alkalinus (strain CBS 110278 / VKM F-3762 / F11) TaxID=1314773 RepID=A0A3N2QAM1_SODAK|nr:hypothetical protein SODALDRAFT_356025 [Sodiomyces alkalinus F11]ROT43800.1 hypothetical protein SODALDRAFT_356025 [Sodiomyces alkalinus F11]